MNIQSIIVVLIVAVAVAAAIFVHHRGDKGDGCNGCPGKGSGCNGCCR